MHSSFSPILLVDDSEDDRFFFLRAAATAKVANPIETAEDGQVAIEWLTARIQSLGEGLPLPVVMLLDLKMPRKSGFQVIEWVRKQEALDALPIVVFTASNQDVDLRRAYAAGANSFLVKPVDHAGLVEMARTLGLYWAMMNRQPVESRVRVPTLV